jgi:G3E family GTPase
LGSDGRIDASPVCPSKTESPFFGLQDPCVCCAMRDHQLGILENLEEELGWKQGEAEG